MDMPIYWLPYSRLTLYSPLSLDDVVGLLSDQVFRRRILRWGWRDAGTFEGEVSYRGFNINRVLSYRNSWQPVIYGSFRELPKGIQINITVTMHHVVIVFSLCFLLLFCPLLFPIFHVGSIISNAFDSVSKFANLMGSIACFGLIPYSIILLPFSYEANKTVEFLEGVFRSHKTPAI